MCVVETIINAPENELSFARIISFSVLRANLKESIRATCIINEKSITDEYKNRNDINTNDKSKRRLAKNHNPA